MKQKLYLYMGYLFFVSFLGCGSTLYFQDNFPYPSVKNSLTNLKYMATITATKKVKGGFSNFSKKRFQIHIKNSANQILLSDNYVFACGAFSNCGTWISSNNLNIKITEVGSRYSTVNDQNNQKLLNNGPKPLCDLNYIFVKELNKFILDSKTVY